MHEECNDIVFIDSNKNHISINPDTNFEILKLSESTDDSNVIDLNDCKDILIASLFAQIEFFKKQLIEKDYIIPSLLDKDRNTNKTVT